MKVVVTQDHIACGRPGLPKRCPIALALGGNVLVYGGMVVMSDGSHRLLPEEARESVSDFDHERPVQPLEFEF
jgi:hypothetical protein